MARLPLLEIDHRGRPHHPGHWHVMLNGQRVGHHVMALAIVQGLPTPEGQSSKQRSVWAKLLVSNHGELPQELSAILPENASVAQANFIITFEAEVDLPAELTDLEFASASGEIRFCDEVVHG